MFSNLLLGTLQRFQMEEKKISSVEKVQVSFVVDMIGFSDRLYKFSSHIIQSINFTG